MNATLKECPFCDSANLHKTGNDIGSEYVECADCGASGPASDHSSNAEEYWNRRAIALPVAAGSAHDVCRESERLYRQSAKDAIERAEKAEARLVGLEADAMRWRYLRDLNYDLTGIPGQPCLALPNGMNSGYYLTGPEAVFAVDTSMAEIVPK